MTSDLATSVKPGRRGGRPKIAPDDVRVSHGVKLSKNELDEAKKLAKDAGLNFSMYCRNAILNAYPARPVPPINMNAYLRLARLATALETMAKAGEVQNAEALSERLSDVRILLKSTRMQLLGIDHTGDTQRDR